MAVLHGRAMRARARAKKSNQVNPEFLLFVAFFPPLSLSMSLYTGRKVEKKVSTCGNVELGAGGRGKKPQSQPPASQSVRPRKTTVGSGAKRENKKMPLDLSFFSFFFFFFAAFPYKVDDVIERGGVLFFFLPSSPFPHDYAPPPFLPSFRYCTFVYIVIHRKKPPGRGEGKGGLNSDVGIEQ